MYFNRLASLYLEATTWIQRQVPLSLSDISTETSFDWDGTPAHKHFVWQDCYDGLFKCARLQVPMDWQETSVEKGKTIELAVIKVEATVPITDRTYGGAVVLNPGILNDQVDQAGAESAKYFEVAGMSERFSLLHFDIIGFDPRGINNTRPMLNCFPNHLEAAAYGIEQDAQGMIGSSDTSFDNLWASERALADGCSKRAGKIGIAKHMSTPPVARDVIEIFERHGEWRETEARRLLNSAAEELPIKERIEVLERTGYIPGQEMVQYWGFSYGTILGATISAMYPDRIKSAVLDGVGDSHDYMAGGWTTNLQDTDLTFVKLADYCFRGGPHHCAFWDKDGPAVIVENIGKTIAKLKSDPIGVPGNNAYGPQLVTYNDFKRLVLEIVYNPLREFPLTAQILHELSKGEGTALAAWKAKNRPTIGEPVSEQCNKDGPYSPSCYTNSRIWDAMYGVTCSDALPRLGETKEEYRKYADSIIAQSRLIGEAWASILLPCTAWHARPHWRYDGNFHNKTANPILFAGNTIDPVTPLRNAFKMARGFEGAGVLHQNSEGHCTYGAVSMCTGRALRQYFQTGQLPGDKGGLDGFDGYGALCEPSRQPFDGYEKSMSMPSLPEGESDLDLWEALVSLNQVWP